MQNLPQYFGNGDKSGYGRIHWFLTPAYNQINKPTDEEKQSKPNYGGYDLELFDPDQSQSFGITHIVKYRVKSFLKIDPKANYESNPYDLSKLIDNRVTHEDLITYYIFSPWESEKNAQNQAYEHLKKWLKLDLDHDETWHVYFTTKFESCISLV